MEPILPSAVSAFGAKAKLATPGASGEPEDQLRAPFDQPRGKPLRSSTGFRSKMQVTVTPLISN